MDLERAETVSLILGQEFLTWLWFASETSNGLFRTKDGEAFSVTVEQKVSVQGGEGEAKRVHQRKSDQNSCKGQRRALQGRAVKIAATFFRGNTGFCCLCQMRTLLRQNGRFDLLHRCDGHGNGAKSGHQG